MDEGKMKIDWFDGNDFIFWKMQIKNLLYHNNVHQLLSEGKSYSIKKKDCELLDRQVPCVVRLVLAQKVAFNITDEKKTANLMKALYNIFEKPLASNEVSGFCYTLPISDISIDSWLMACSRRVSISRE